MVGPADGTAAAPVLPSCVPSTARASRCPAASSPSRSPWPRPRAARTRPSRRPASITGVVTTAVPALRPLRVTADIKVCGTQLPDEAIAVGAGGVLANAVVTLTGVKVTTPYPDPQVVNERLPLRAARAAGAAGRADEDHEQGSAAAHDQRPAGRRPHALQRRPAGARPGGDAAAERRRSGAAHLQHAHVDARLHRGHRRDGGRVAAPTDASS